MTKVGQDRQHGDLEQYVLWTLREVYAEQPIDCDAAGHYHNEVESYVVDGSQLKISVADVLGIA